MGKFVCNFISYALKRTVDITVVVPTPTLTDGSTFQKISRLKRKCPPDKQAGISLSCVFNIQN